MENCEQGEKRKRVNEGIEMAEWREYFMSLLGGVEKKVEREIGGRGMEEGEEMDIEREEIKRAIGRLRDGKASGVDGISREVWKQGREEMESWVEGFCNRVWKGKWWPED